MHKSELINQISDLLVYVFNSFSVPGKTSELRELVENIYNAILLGVMDNTPNEITETLHELIKGDNIDIPAFCFYAEKCLASYCSDALDDYEKEPLAEQVLSKNEQIRDRDRFIDFQDRIRYLYHKHYHCPSERFQGKGVVYCVITGGYDSIYEPVTEGSDLDYVLLTDSPVEGYSGKWNIRVVENPEGLSPKLLSRYLKMLPFDLFPEYDWSVYVDGNLFIRESIDSFVDLYAKNSGMICFPHHVSRTIEEEAEGIINNGMAGREELLEQINRYHSEGFENDTHMIEAGCMVRDHHDEQLKKVMLDWWEEYRKYKHGRDQMSFGYACWKNRYDYDICDMIIVDNPWIKGMVIH